MRIALASVADTPTVRAVESALRSSGHVVVRVSPVGKEDLSWPETGHAVGAAVSEGHCNRGVALCWTGHGVAIAANRIPGVRAAYCADAKAVTEAVSWHDANVLALSLLNTTPETAAFLVEEWLAAERGLNRDHSSRIRRLERVGTVPS